MCGDGSRVSMGGTIAVLQDLKADAVNGRLKDVSLLFSSYDSQSTIATFQPDLQSSDMAVDMGKWSIVIHRSGDLTNTADEKDVLHSFPFRPDAMLNGNLNTSFRLPKKLDLGVGGEGVIGRKISLVRNTPLGLTVFRQGIIGYN